MHEGPTTAPRKSVHLVTQLQHLGNLLYVELSRKLENLLPGLLRKDIPREIAELGQTILPTPTHEEDLCQYTGVEELCIICAALLPMRMVGKVVWHHTPLWLGGEQIFP
jgi:hypothetical protein